MTKRTRIAGLLLLLVGIAAVASGYLSYSDVEMLHSRKGPISDSHLDWEEKGFTLIEQETGHKVRGTDGLRFYFSWPQQKWMSVFAPPSGTAELAILIANYKPKMVSLKIYKFPRKEYDDFLRDFDLASSGYHFMRRGHDGNAFSYERWQQGVAVSYSGNASFSSKDAKVYQIVESLVAKVSRGKDIAH